MKIIKPSVEFFGAGPTDYAGTLAFIERCGRLCYKSEDKITDSSAEGFVKRLISAGHLAMVEHSNFVVRAAISDLAGARLTAGKYLNVAIRPGCTYIGGNLTAWFQRCMKVGVKGPFKAFADVYGGLFGLPPTIAGRPIGWNPDGRSWQVCPHDEITKALHRYSAKFICDRGVSHELVRHRPCSFAQESTRYVNYGGKDMEFIEPAGFEEWPMGAKSKFVAACADAKDRYEYFLAGGLNPQQARAVLPNALKTEIIVTADAAEWAHIKKLRTHPSAHPDMVRIMNMMPWAELGV